MDVQVYLRLIWRKEKSNRDKEVVKKKNWQLDLVSIWTATVMWEIQLKFLPPSLLCLLLFQGSSAMSQILVQKLGALLHISPLLKSPNRSLQKTAMSLLGNMSRTSSLQTSMGKKKHKVLTLDVCFAGSSVSVCKCWISPRKTDVLSVFYVFSVAKQILPELTGLLSSPREMGNSDETISTACSTVRSLMLADTEVSKKVINNELITSLADLSENEWVITYLFISVWEIQLPQLWQTCMRLFDCVKHFERPLCLTGAVRINLPFTYLPVSFSHVDHFEICLKISASTLIQLWGMDYFFQCCELHKHNCTHLRGIDATERKTTEISDVDISKNLGE